MPKTLTLSTELINAILQYLGTRPYQEVNQFIVGLQTEAAPQIKQEEAITEVEPKCCHTQT